MKWRFLSAGMFRRAGYRRRRIGWSAVVISVVAIEVALVQPLAFAPSASASLSAQAHAYPNFNGKVPTNTSTCSGVKSLPGGGEKLPLTVSSGDGGQVGAMINVCIDGHGPYPFVIDSGAGQTTINATLARRLHLKVTASKSEGGTGGCVDHTAEVTVDSWSADGLVLAGQQFAADTEPGEGGKGEPDGSLGNDVLSRFGAVRIDYKNSALVLPGPEGTPLSTAVFQGPKGTAPADLTNGSGVVVPVLASIGPQDDFLFPSITLNGASESFVVDTGSSRSSVDASLTKSASLKATNLADTQDTVCSIVSVPIVKTGPWSINGTALKPQIVDSLNLNLGGPKGIIGSDMLAGRGWVVLDYTGGLLVLGP